MHELLQGGAKPSRRNEFTGTPGLPLSFRESRHNAKSSRFSLSLSHPPQFLSFRFFLSCFFSHWSLGEPLSTKHTPLRVKKPISKPARPMAEADGCYIQYCTKHLEGSTLVTMYQENDQRKGWKPEVLLISEDWKEAPGTDGGAKGNETNRAMVAHAQLHHA